ncbi:MAG: PAS domain-containing protein [Rhodospirillales bacterium]|nr:PAS domain-containing protein [Rhodospirillales bacterium]
MAIWKQVPNWTYELFVPDTPPEEFGGFAPLIRLWQGKREERRLPAWSDFDFYDFKGWHGSVAVQEVIAEPFDLRCRLWGSHLTQVLGADNTGKRFSELGSTYTENDLSYLHELCRCGAIGKSHGSLDWLQRHYKSVAFVDLPLADDGTTVSHLLTVLTETSREPAP